MLRVISISIIFLAFYTPVLAIEYAFRQLNLPVSDFQLITVSTASGINNSGQIVGKVDTTDVGPVLRRFLTRADDVFGDLFNLTLCDKLIRGQVPE